LINESHGGLSPKISANYDEYQEQTIKPINATFFYYFFSAEKGKRAFAKWMLSTFSYPNEKVRMAYMRYFS
jgi:hypothetical protein